MAQTQLAGRLLSRLTANGGGDMLKSSIPGAILSGLFSTVTTGNPVAGLLTGALDLGLGLGTAKAIGKYAPQYAGKYRNYVTDENLAKYAGKGALPATAVSRVYEPSVQQNIANVAGSVAAPLLVEPLFLPAQMQQTTNQSVTQQQQLGQQEMLNQMYAPYTADGTLYQLQGLPSRVTG